MADETVMASDVFGYSYSRFSDLVAQLRAASDVKKQAEEESKRLNKELQLLWTDVAEKTVVEDGCKVTLVSSSNSTISKELLVQAGVLASVIRDCTKVVEYQFVKVTPTK
jgi:hypothetical protein